MSVTLPVWLLVLIIVVSVVVGIWTSYVVFGTIKGSSSG